MQFAKGASTKIYGLDYRESLDEVVLVKFSASNMHVKSVLMLKYSVRSFSRNNSVYIKKEICDFFQYSHCSWGGRLKPRTVHIENNKKKKYIYIYIYNINCLYFFQWIIFNWLSFFCIFIYLIIYYLFINLFTIYLLIIYSLFINYLLFIYLFIYS